MLEVTEEQANESRSLGSSGCREAERLEMVMERETARNS
jgi:hypothetical protein